MDRYPVPHLQGFSGALVGKSVFSKVFPEYFSERAITTSFGLFEFPHIFGPHSASPAVQMDRFSVYPLHGLGVPSLESNGHLDLNGTLSSKVAAIREFPRPTSKCQLRRFLGMVIVYYRFLPDCFDTILLLKSLLLGPEGSFELSSGASVAFDKMNAVLPDETPLTHSAPDAPVSLPVHSSSVSVSAVIQRRLASQIQP
ncbi:hypothetical protein SprV_0100221100 [Sparganum proliferum]